MRHDLHWLDMTDRILFRIAVTVLVHRCVLPNSVVDVDTVCLFTARLDKFWMHQDVMYDSAADLTGIGDRSVRESS